MRLARSIRRWLSGALVLALLFAQLATAAHACPALVSSMRAPGASMPCFDAMEDGTPHSMDPDQPALCHEHCNPSAKAVDSGNAPALAAPPMFAVLTIATSDDDAAPAASAWRHQLRLRERTRPPAHSVLHCCWRI